jgi:hypothetical protein
LATEIGKQRKGVTMKRILPVLMLMLVCAAIFAAAPAMYAQPSHVAAQFVFQGTHDYGYSNPQLGVRLSGAYRFERVAVIADFDAERAQKNFLDNGTDLHASAGFRFYPVGFLYGEASVSTGGQLNSQYTKTGTRAIFGSGISISDYLQIGAGYLGSDHTINQVSGARVYCDAFVPIRRRLYVKASGQGDFVGFQNDHADNILHIRAQRFRVSYGIALRL